MAKCDVTVQKKFTINTGNYSSIQPSVSITIHNINTDDIKEVHELTEIIADGLFHEQLKSDSETMNTIKSMGYKDYIKEIDFSMMSDVIENAIKKLGKFIPF